MPAVLSPTSRRRLLLALTLALGSTALLPAAQAQSTDSYPRKPITLIIPFQGGITEQMGRLFGNELEKTLGTPVIVDVRPGAGGVIGAKYAARAPADGYTLVITNGLSQETAKGTADSFNDFEAITSLMEQPFLLYVKPDSEIQDFGGYIEQAKANPGKVSYGSVGPNTTAHHIGQGLEQAAGIRLTHVPYRGGGAQALAVMSGEATSGWLTAAFIKPYAEGGTLRPLVIVAPERNPVFPDVPSVTEAGFPELAQLSSWWGVFTPKGLPPEVKTRLVEATETIAAQGVLNNFITQSGGRILPQGPAATEQRVRDDIAFWQTQQSK